MARPEATISVNVAMFRETRGGSFRLPELAGRSPVACMQCWARHLQIDRKSIVAITINLYPRQTVSAQSPQAFSIRQ
jgi:hypothetical protein